MMKKAKVDLAVPYQIGHLTNYVLVRQFKFPFIYDMELDELIIRDHDVIMNKEWTRTNKCLQKHTGNEVMFLKGWIEKNTDEKILTFIKDFLGANDVINWTGYRVLSLINESKGNTFWRLELFAKHPDSRTEVYSGEDAPNVITTTNLEKENKI